jgi:hypothetical protein
VRSVRIEPQKPNTSVTPAVADFTVRTNKGAGMSSPAPWLQLST